MQDTVLKNIAIGHLHEELGAKMVEFAGYRMPLQYSGLKEEHLCVRNGLGVFDVSHMGEFIISGPNALALIQKVTSNDASTLVDGKVQYSCLPNFDGGIVDDLLVYRFSEESYCLVVNASNIQKDWDWISSQNDVGAEMKNISDNMSLFAVQGPKAVEAMQSLTEVDLGAMDYYTSQYAAFAGIDTVLISATGYTGSGGFEIYVKNSEAEQVWKAIMKAGELFGIKPCGLAARDTLRLEMGFCLYGNDIDESTSPLEAGLGWITKFTKDFVNSENLKAQKEQGVNKRLVGFEMIDRGIPRKGYEIVDGTGEIIGRVTSGTMSPSMDKAIGMGYVTKEMSKSETEVYIRVRSKDIKAVVVRPPFYKK